MTGSFYVLLSLAEAIVAFLPAVGTAAARRSKTVLRRTSQYRTAVAATLTKPVCRLRDRLRQSNAAGNAAPAGETLSP